MPSIIIEFPLTLLRVFLTVFVYCTPILGIWLVSSLVAFTNAPLWLSLLSGILLFPLIPLSWELHSSQHWRQKYPQKIPILTWGDRLTLKTLVLNLAFIICLLATCPQSSFLALSTRGDWMLEGKQGAGVEQLRRGLFESANYLEWLYLAFRNNPFEEYEDIITIKPQPTRQEKPDSQQKKWPWLGQTIHPLVANMPANVESSLESVAEYIAQREPDPFLRVKALHDYVVDRVAYDVESYRAGLYPPQDAETVFKTHKAVCAGYAKLLAALGQVVGENIVYVVGDSRSEASDLSGEGHAWNAAQIQGNWYLIDATWDSGYINESGFTKQYDTSYLFPPPQVMSISHFPDDPTWQLLAQPLSRGEFLRQPMLRPRFFAEGLTLVSPTRSQTDVGLNAIIQLKNPTQRWIMTQAVSETGESFDCAETTQQTPISCVLPSRGTYEVKLFTNNERYGQFDYVGALEFNRK